MFTAFDKALVPVVVGVILYGFKHFGLTPDVQFSGALTTIVTAALVWLTPNKK